MCFSINNPGLVSEQSCVLRKLDVGEIATTQHFVPKSSKPQLSLCPKTEWCYYCWRQWMARSGQWHLFNTCLHISGYFLFVLLCRLDNNTPHQSCTDQLYIMFLCTSTFMHLLFTNCVSVSFSTLNIHVSLEAGIHQFLQYWYCLIFPFTVQSLCKKATILQGKWQKGSNSGILLLQKSLKSQWSKARIHTKDTVMNQVIKYYKMYLDQPKNCGIHD